MTDRIRGAGGRPAGVQATPARALDWATAATEARRQRDAAATVARSEQQRQRRQDHAWSPKEFSRTRKV
jgi:hypothetical protein